MTKTEAIKWLSNLKMDIGKTQHQELWHYEQAIDEIIQALEQEPSCRNTRQVDLISREQAIKEISDEFENEWEEADVNFNHGLNMALSIIKALSVLDQDEIIQCKDCKHWHEWENGTGACHRSNSIWVGTDYDDFCSFAERMESDTE